MEMDIVKAAYAGIVLGLITALFALFTRVRLLESTVKVIQAEAMQDREARREIGGKMETLGLQMVELGREMSGVAAIIRTAVIQNRSITR
jgi:hypothetical protein